MVVRGEDAGWIGEICEGKKVSGKKVSGIVGCLVDPTL